jgi:hypothetical protein
MRKLIICILLIAIFGSAIAVPRYKKFADQKAIAQEALRFEVNYGRYGIGNLSCMIDENGDFFIFQDVASPPQEARKLALWIIKMTDEVK